VKEVTATDDDKNHNTDMETKETDTESAKPNKKGVKKEVQLRKS
jgi:hypothetical protein